MRSISEYKYEKLIKFLQEKKIDILLIFDGEDSPNVNLQYLTGHPSDAHILVDSSGESILVPWDINIAEKHSEVDEIIDPSNFKYNWALTIKHIIEKKWKKKNAKIGVTSFFPYGSVIKMKSLIPGITFFDEPLLISNFLQKLRATKTEFEIKQLKEAARIGTETIKDIEDFCLNSSFKTEKDLAFLVRKKMGEYGADDIAFDTLVANSQRSHEIHQYPPASDQQFGFPGLALIDFGAKFKGYHSDITVPISFGELTNEQYEMRELTIETYEKVIDSLEVGMPLWKLHNITEQILKKSGFNMPYALGHGLGLSVHDSPFISRKPTDEHSLKYWKEEKFEDGMVFTIEPFIFKKDVGGTRLENDILIHNSKIEVISKSKPIII